ncbi:hypothetical protein CCAX7_52320 [Capsulimonas corticalis]|uniref:Uncharacterized protein n=1 Tax=Capsulimonas corticalis TaxID=2219043 RepID=A0A402CP01_9BACT|nr:VOC family protein [Capsulimonas corticalis]BDI33181.1 hypothetical protein CCAX7_52320 [Capsulimonas corticalis]
MQQRLSLLTVGVNDLAAVRAFYEEKFEWTPVAASADIVFFQMNGFLLAFFGKEALAADANLAAETAGAKPFTLAYNVQTETEVNALFALLESRGVGIVKRPEATFLDMWSMLRATCGRLPAIHILNWTGRGMSRGIGISPVCKPRCIKSYYKVACYAEV